MTPATILLRAAVALALLAPPAAQADPPEGCVGIPSVPEAYVCVTQWTPENAVPTVGLGPGQTVTIPEFCVFQCVGPTPVTVPSIVIGQGDGVIAKVKYYGRTHTVSVPPLDDPELLIQQVVQTVTDLVATVLHVVGDNVASVPGVFTAQATIWCWGCGTEWEGALVGRFTGTINGRSFSNAEMGATVYHTAPAGGYSCNLSGTAHGPIYIDDTWAYFTWTQTGNTIRMSIFGGIWGTAYATFHIHNPTGNPCGQQVDMVLAGTFVED